MKEWKYECTKVRKNEGMEIRKNGGMNVRKKYGFMDLWIYEVMQGLDTEPSMCIYMTDGSV